MKHIRRLLLLLLVVACSGRQDATDEDKAAAVAKTSYEALYDGHAQLFLDARLHADQMPDSYREQLLENYRHHVEEVKRDHRGVRSVEVTKVQSDSTLHIMQVFLLIGYGDDTCEEVVVPMVQQQEKWLMK